MRQSIHAKALPWDSQGPNMYFRAPESFLYDS
ncbi:uncharacterized protein G2W53_018098 [Senna tora]|uniref:Uncharacterized protein n=1 Tax=Senna tora TaxID=362788 RepID=A0A834TZW9_9FABA|nr:uncharacterized protein G2W53_018098 [Senna tora]